MGYVLDIAERESEEMAPKRERELGHSRERVDQRECVQRGEGCRSVAVSKSSRFRFSVVSILNITEIDFKSDS